MTPSPHTYRGAHGIRHDGACRSVRIVVGTHCACRGASLYLAAASVKLDEVCSHGPVRRTGKADKAVALDGSERRPPPERRRSEPAGAADRLSELIFDAEPGKRQA